MAVGAFVWADLSTFEAGKAQHFYSSAMGWGFPLETDGYMTASAGGWPVAGLYPMPERFVRMDMPSFWMSYIQVDSADRAADLTLAMGGKVEVGPEERRGAGRYALIRDPVGAGFTVIEAPTFVGRATRNALFVESAAAVCPFYEALFGWAFQLIGADRWKIVLQGVPVGEPHQVPDPVMRGTEQYWGIAFPGGPARLRVAGAEPVADVSWLCGPHTLWRDDQGAAFFTPAHTTAHTAGGGTGP